MPIHRRAHIDNIQRPVRTIVVSDGPEPRIFCWRWNRMDHQCGEKHVQTPTAANTLTLKPITDVGSQDEITTPCLGHRVAHPTGGHRHAALNCRRGVAVCPRFNQSSARIPPPAATDVVQRVAGVDPTIRLPFPQVKTVSRRIAGPVTGIRRGCRKSSTTLSEY